MHGCLFTLWKGVSVTPSEGIDCNITYNTCREEPSVVDLCSSKSKVETDKYLTV